jgi:hypothetical protein
MNFNACYKVIRRMIQNQFIHTGSQSNLVCHEILNYIAACHHMEKAKKHYCKLIKAKNNVKETVN